MADKKDFYYPSTYNSNDSGQLKAFASQISNIARKLASVLKSGDGDSIPSIDDIMSAYSKLYSMVFENRKHKSPDLNTGHGKSFGTEFMKQFSVNSDIPKDMRDWEPGLKHVVSIFEDIENAANLMYKNIGFYSVDKTMVLLHDLYFGLKKFYEKLEDHGWDLEVRHWDEEEETEKEDKISGAPTSESSYKLNNLKNRAVELLGRMGAWISDTFPGSDYSKVEPIMLSIIDNVKELSGFVDSHTTPSQANSRNASSDVIRSVLESIKVFVSNLKENGFNQNSSVSKISAILDDLTKKFARFEEAVGPLTHSKKEDRVSGKMTIMAMRKMAGVVLTHKDSDDQAQLREISGLLEAGVNQRNITGKGGATTIIEDAAYVALCVANDKMDGKTYNTWDRLTYNFGKFSNEIPKRERALVEKVVQMCRLPINGSQKTAARATLRPAETWLSENKKQVNKALETAIKGTSKLLSGLISKEEALQNWRIVLKRSEMLEDIEKKSEFSEKLKERAKKEIEKIDKESYLRDGLVESLKKARELTGEHESRPTDDLKSKATEAWKKLLADIENLRTVTKYPQLGNIFVAEAKEEIENLENPQSNRSVLASVVRKYIKMSNLIKSAKYEFMEHVQSILTNKNSGFGVSLPLAVIYDGDEKNAIDDVNDVVTARFKYRDHVINMKIKEDHVSYEITGDDKPVKGEKTINSDTFTVEFKSVVAKIKDLF